MTQSLAITLPADEAFEQAEVFAQAEHWLALAEQLSNAKENYQQAAALAAGNSPAITSLAKGDASFSSEEAKKYLDLALQAINDPELIADPAKSQIRAKLILRLAGVAARLNLNQYAQTIACCARLEDDHGYSKYYVVRRTLHLLLTHGFNGGNGQIVKEDILFKSRMVEQQRLEFQCPESAISSSNVHCSLRWFKLDERCNYQYLNRARRSLVTRPQVPQVVRFAAEELASLHSAPGSLRFSEINLTGNLEGRKFIRMEQSYVVDDDTTGDTSLILQIEFSWS